MLNSRDLSLLRPDVEANVRAWIQLCAAEGLPVLVTQTVRDNEYQAKLYAQGRTAPGKVVTNSKRTTFHGAGLAVDFCKNLRGGEYSDAAFFDRAIEIAKAMGFSSGRDWASFSEKCHLQWDELGAYRFSYEKMPARMPAYEEVSEVRYNTLEELEGKKTYHKVMSDLWHAHIFRGKADGSLDLSEDMIRIFVVNYRAGVYDAALLAKGMVRDQTV